MYIYGAGLTSQRVTVDGTARGYTSDKQSVLLGQLTASYHGLMSGREFHGLPR